MSDNSPRTNRWLILLAIFLCFIFGGIFTRSSAIPTQVNTDSEMELALSDHNDRQIIQSTPTPTPSSVPSDKKANNTIEGSWTSSGSDWMFLVDGTPYTGWLTDTDGKRYYFDDNGIMQTGWVDSGKKRYYMDLDGIMQTGDIEVNGKTYHLNEDGSLEGYRAKKSSASEAETKNKPKSNSNADSTTDVSSTEKKAVALTFDDGPSSFTGRLLDCLEANHAKATFFMTGTEIANFPDEVKRMKELGYELGNHTYDHTDLTTLSIEDINSEIEKVDTQLLELTGQGASVVRPPYGSVNDTVRSTVGTPMILWSIDTLDWKTQDPDSIVKEVMEHIEDGSVILMHDIFSTTVDAAEILIPKLIEEGYELLTIHELATKRGVELNAHATYSEFAVQD